MTFLHVIGLASIGTGFPYCEGSVQRPELGSDLGRTPFPGPSQDERMGRSLSDDDQDARNVLLGISARESSET